jgi:ABC-2 type transport system permease protein
MLKFTASFIKEFKVLLKDKTGLVILFIMPLFLVVIMTLIQNEAYKSFNETGIPVLFLNFDKDRLGNEVEQGFNDLSIFNITSGTKEDYPDEASIKKNILGGEHLVALIIPKEATNVLRANVEEMIKLLMQDSLSESTDSLGQVNFKIIIDPVAKKSFVVAVNSGLKEYIASIKTKLLFELLAQNISESIGNKHEIKIPEEDFFVFNEEYALPKEEGEIYEPNAVQHNIPAWSIFSIFFIVLPLSVSIINERSEGLSIRLRTFPGSYLSILSGKLILYLAIAFVQFAMVLLLGKFFFPLINLPQLDIGNHFFSLAMLTFSVSIAAIGYGLMIGTLFDAPPQASIFGGISILIMSALGGVWIPVNIMPELMKTISEFSPLNWALTGYYELFIKGGGWTDIQYNVMKLFSFFIICLISSYILHKAKHKLQ